MHISIISGGFPCQDTSVAGLHAGIAGKESCLVFEFLRLLADVKPDYAVFENTGGFRTNGLREVLEHIARIGYDAEWYTLRASGFGAPHIRKRTFILAHTKRYEQPSPQSCDGEIRRVGGIIEPLPWNRDWESALCEFRRMDDGSTYGVDRTDTIRNAVVPQVAFPIFKAIATNEGVT